MISNQIDSIINEQIATAQQIIHKSGASKLQLIRESIQTRSSLKMTVKNMVDINRRLKQMFVSQPSTDLPINQSAQYIMQTSNIVLNQFPGICYNINTLVNEHQLSLYDLLDLDFTTLLSEQINLEAMSKLLQTLNVLPHHFSNLLVCRYVLFYANYHILVSNNVIVRLPAQCITSKPKQSTEFIVLYQKLFNRPIYRGSNQPYVIEASQALLSSAILEPVDYGLVVSNAQFLTISTTFSQNIQIQCDQKLNINQPVRLDLQTQKVQMTNAFYHPVAEIVAQLELCSQMRRQVNFDQLENKQIEVLLALQFEVDQTQKCQLAIARQSGGFIKALKLLGDERVFYQLEKTHTEYADERQGLVQVELMLPILFEGFYDAQKLQFKSLKQNFQILKFENADQVLSLKKIAMQKSDFFSQKLKQKFKFSDSVAQNVAKKEESEDKNEQVANCFCLVNQNLSNQWIAGEPRVEVECDLAISIQICDNKLLIELEQFADGDLKQIQFGASKEEIAMQVLIAAAQKKLHIDLGFDFFIDAYVNFLQKKQNSDQVQVPILFQDQRFDARIAKLLLLQSNELVAMVTELEITSCQDRELPVFQPMIENIFSQDQLKSTAMDAFELKIQNFSDQTSQHNSLVKSFDGLFSFPLDEKQLFSMPIEPPQIFDTKLFEAPPSQPKMSFQLSANSMNLGSQIASLQQQCKVDQEQFKLKNIHGYVRYHLPSYNVAIVAFCDPFNRQDQWNHSMAIWHLPKEFSTIKLKRFASKEVQISAEGEQIYIARALVKCSVHPLEANSGIYVVDEATLINYQDPCDKFSLTHQDQVNQTVEGSVYWQEIQKQQKSSTSYGFVRLASGHERHFYLQKQQSVLGHLVKLKLFSSDSQAHPNSCELVQDLIPPPDRHKFLFGRIIGIYQELPAQTEQLLKSSFRLQQIKNSNYQTVNGMILTEPMQGTHVDLCYFRLILPMQMVQQLKPGLGIYFTLKELALHKVVDQTDSLYQTPVDLVNIILQNKTSNQKFAQPSQDVGNSKKLSCWAVDNICLQKDQFSGYYKTIQQRNCSGIQADGLFFDRYGKVLANGFESLVYVPRPTLNIQPAIFKEQERYLFNVHFVFNEQKQAFVPEANQIRKIRQDVSSRRIQGKIIQLQQEKRCPIYVFQPNVDHQIKNDVGRVLECLQESLTPESHCYIVSPTAFYLLSNEILNKLSNVSQSQYKTVFEKLINGQISLNLKQVSIGLQSDGEFERHKDVYQTIQLLQQNIYTTKDDQGNRHNLFWCRYADELCCSEEIQVEAQEPEPEKNSEVDFLSY
uniref:Uncharacterized protein n=1 Tax=Trepomonas sp. PC1 TaxID=1076344 RepID=A0A146K736_9EUKA|eukprot:JAP91319.1 hypothetical protein TPC1_17105 [Trepomonas sp. PC1]